MQLKLSSLDVVQGHRARVGTMAWSSHILSSGSRDRNILQRDVRAPEDYIHKLVGHRSEVCTHAHSHTHTHIHAALALCCLLWLYQLSEVLRHS